MGLFGKKDDASAESHATAQLAAEVETVRSVLAQYPLATELHLGAPSRCPRCGNFGFVESVNRVKGVCYNTCIACRIDWVITQRAIKAYRAAPVDPEIDTTGVLLQPDVVAKPPAVDEPLPHVAEEPMFPETATLDLRAPSPETTIKWEPRPPRAEPAPVPSDTEAEAGPEADAEADAAPAPPPPEDNPHLPLQPAAPSVAAHVARTSSTRNASPDAPLRVLAVEDNPFDYLLLETIVDPNQHADVELVQAATRAEGESLAAGSPFDVILLDLDLPDSTGMATVLEWNHGANAKAPIIVISDTSDADLIRQARALGVAHYVRKAHLGQLAESGPAGRERFVHLLQQTVTRAAQPTDVGTIF